MGFWSTYADADADADGYGIIFLEQQGFFLALNEDEEVGSTDKVPVRSFSFFDLFDGFARLPTAVP